MPSKRGRGAPPHTTPHHPRSETPPAPPLHRIYTQLGAQKRGLRSEELSAALVELGFLKPTAVLEVEENLVMQRLWRHLTGGAGAGDEAVTEAGLLAFMAEALSDDKHATLGGDDDGDDAAALYADVAKLWRAALANKPTHNVRGATEAELQSEEAECTFAPRINKKSTKLDAAYDEAGARHDRLYDGAKARQQKVEKQRLEKAEAQMKECSFKPAISKGSAKAAAETSRGAWTTRLQQPKEPPRGADVLSHEERELEKCTFTPRLSSYTPRVTTAKARPPPPGYDGTVARMRRAAQERKEREAEAEAALTRTGATPSTRGPPSFATSSRADRKAERAPLLYMDVALGKSRTGRIGVHEGDDPAVLADNFARTYQLDATLRGRLQALIEEQLEKLDRSGAATPVAPFTAP